MFTTRMNWLHVTFQSHMSEDQNHLFSVIKEKVEWITLKYNQTSFTKLRVLKQRFNMNSSCDAKLTECVSALSEESKHSHLICRQETDRLFDQLFTWNQVWFCSSGFRPELHLHEHHEGQAEDQEEDLQESGVCVCVCVCVCLWIMMSLRVWLTMCHVMSLRVWSSLMRNWGGPSCSQRRRGHISRGRSLWMDSDTLTCWVPQLLFKNCLLGPTETLSLRCSWMFLI